MDWTLPLTVALVVGASVGALLVQRWSLNRAIRKKRAEEPPPVDD